MCRYLKPSLVDLRTIVKKLVSKYYGLILTLGTLTRNSGRSRAAKIVLKGRIVSGTKSCLSKKVDKISFRVCKYGPSYLTKESELLAIKGK